MEKILITGGAGFIGSHLVDYLMSEAAAATLGLRQGPRLTVVDNFDDFYDPALKRANVEPHLGRDNFELVAADITDAGAMNELFARRQFDAVVHLAACAGVRPSLADPLAYEATNVRGTYALLEAARRSGVRQFVFGSSSSVYGINARVPFCEDDLISQPISPYAATKIAGEAACHVYSHLYGMRVVCLRFFTVYGARQRPDLAIHKFARLIEAGRPIPLYGDGKTERDYTYIDDIIAGVVAALGYQASAYEVINLGESATVELRRLVELLEQALGKRALIEPQPAQPGDVPRTCANIEKARRLLGYNPQTPIETGIRKFIAWFRGKGGEP
ncbi:MAG: GDP-mannose 4,6-dehydratase [Blastocatellia bacterium]